VRLGKEGAGGKEGWFGENFLDVNKKPIGMVKSNGGRLMPGPQVVINIPVVR
jgi:hypothetical protein